MTPVASGVTDAEQDQLVFFSCAFERFRSPCVPINRIVGMLQQIWASLVDQPVRHLRSLEAARACVRDCLAERAGRDRPVRSVPTCAAADNDDRLRRFMPYPEAFFNGVRISAIFDDKTPSASQVAGGFGKCHELFV